MHSTDRLCTSSNQQQFAHLCQAVQPLRVLLTDEHSGALCILQHIRQLPAMLSAEMGRGRGSARRRNNERDRRGRQAKTRTCLGAAPPAAPRCHRASRWSTCLPHSPRQGHRTAPPSGHPAWSARGRVWPAAAAARWPPSGGRQPGRRTRGRHSCTPGRIPGLVTFCLPPTHAREGGQQAPAPSGRELAATAGGTQPAG